MKITTMYLPWFQLQQLNMCLYEFFGFQPKPSKYLTRSIVKLYVRLTIYGMVEARLREHFRVKSDS